MLITLVIKEPFKVRIGKDAVFKFVDAEGAVTDAASRQETDAVLLVVLVFVALKALSHLAVYKLIVKMIVGHLSGKVDAMSAIASAMIGVSVEELVVLQLVHILLALVAIFVHIQLVGVETCSTSTEFSLLRRCGLLIECRHLREGEYARDINELIWRNVFILINNQFEVNAVVIQESGDLHQHKVRVPRPVAKQVGIHKPYLDFSFRHLLSVCGKVIPVQAHKIVVAYQYKYICFWL